MSRFLSSWVLSGLSLALAAWLLGDHMNITDTGDDMGQKVVAVAIVALVFALINSFIAPIIKVLSLPFIVITLGFALLVINALLLLLTSRIADAFGVDFHIDGFWWAVLGSIVISIVNAILGAFTGQKSR